MIHNYNLTEIPNTEYSPAVPVLIKAIGNSFMAIYRDRPDNSRKTRDSARSMG
jgi:hypothetical protein